MTFFTNKTQDEMIFLRINTIIIMFLNYILLVEEMIEVKFNFKYSTFLFSFLSAMPLEYGNRRIFWKDYKKL